MSEEKIIFEGLKEVVVDGELEWTLIFQCANDGIKEGGGLIIIFPPYLHEQSKTYVQSKNYWCDGYIDATTNKQGIQIKINIKQIDTGYIHLKNWPDSWRKVYLTISGGDLKSGDSITVRYGGVDRKFVTGAAAPTRAPIVASKPGGTFLKYKLFVDRNGSGEFVPFPETPYIQVKPGEPVTIKTYCPSVVMAGEDFKIKAVVEDRFRNPVYEYDKELRFLFQNVQTGKIYGGFYQDSKTPISINDGQPGGEESLSEAPMFSSAQRAYSIIPVPGRSVNACIKEEGIYNIVAQCADESLSIECNPIICKDKPEYRVFWGELHSHSNMSPNIRDNMVDITQEDCYMYAKDSSCIDFIALPEQTLSFYSHPDIDLSPDDWQKINKTADQYYVPGEFVTFPAIELHGKRGDTNIVFSGSGFPFARQDIHSISEVWKFYGNKGYLTIPHLHRYCDPLKKKCFQEIWYNWFDTKNWAESNECVERLVEVFSSQWGMFEYQNNEFALKAKTNVPGNTVREFLNIGKKWGVTAGGDNHDGRPGHGGITAVYAKDCSREAIFEALYNRRCFATTGERMIIEFNVCGKMMGDEIKGLDKKPDLYLRAIAANKISRVEIIKNGKVFYEKECGTNAEQVCMLDNSDQTEHMYYYAKVILENGHIGWTSPIWVTLS
jgi:hypothetical protein